MQLHFQLETDNFSFETSNSCLLLHLPYRGTKTVMSLLVNNVPPTAVLTGRRSDKRM